MRRIWSGILGSIAALLAAGCGTAHQQQRGRPTAVMVGRSSINAGSVRGQRPLDIVPPRLARSSGSPFPFIEGNLFRHSVSSPASRVDIEDGGGCTGGPTAALSPDGRFLLYDTSDRQNDAVLMLLDSSTHRTRVFRRNACAPVWASSDKLAFVDTGQADSSGNYRGRVVIQRGIHGADEVAETCEDAATLAWAATKLLTLCDNRSIGLVSSDRPPLTVEDLYSNSRSDRGEEQAWLIAMHPGGDLALINVLEPERDYPADVVMLLDTESGQILSRFAMPNTEQAVGLSGDWSGDQIVTTNATYPGEGTYSPDLLVFDVHRTEITSVSERNILDDHVYLDGSDGSFAADPRFLSQSRDSVGLWFSAYFSETQYVRCDLSSARCATDRGVRAATTPNGFFVTDTPRR